MRLPETRYARSGDVRIAYQVIGQGSLDLVFVPGFISNLEVQWEDPGYAHLLRRLGTFARLIHFDKRGTGLSDGVDPAHLPDLETRMDDVRAVMDAAGSGRAALLGASEGAPMAMLFAATYPERVRALVIYGGYASFHKWVQGPEALARFIDEAGRSWGTGAALRHFAPGRVSDPHFRNWWARFERLSVSPTAAIALARMNAAIDLRGVVGHIHVPTLVLHRAEDVRVRPEAGRWLAKAIPGARFVGLSGRDHPVWTGDIDATVDAIEEFLTGTPPHSGGRRVLAALLAVRITGPQRRGAPTWAEAAESFAAAATALVHRHGGQSLRSAPDGGLFRFEGPGRAIGCARALAECAARLRLGLAQGLHVGEVELTGTGVTGPAVEIADQIARTARPDQLLASAIVAELTAGSGLHFAEAGRIETDGLERPLMLMALVSEQHLEPAHRTAPAASDPTRLSPREHEVLGLVAEGLSNAAIAERLALSEHTVKRHVANILDKLDLPTRGAAAAMLASRPRP